MRRVRLQVAVPAWEPGAHLCVRWEEILEPLETGESRSSGPCPEPTLDVFTAGGEVWL